ncbi:MAG: ABC transporter permease [Planctomycetota bacterium]
MKLGLLVWRNLMRRWVRTLLTIGSLIAAFFLLCVLRTLVTTLQTGAATASDRRLWVQSAVSLFVDLPLSYQAKIESVPGVVETAKWQWFGGYYQEPANQFAQFAVDPEETFDIYPEMEIVDGSIEGFYGNRRGCVVGQGLVDQFGWEVGDTVPIIPTIFPHPDGMDVAWEFQLEGVYEPTRRYFDRRMLLFHWDYFEKTMESGPTGSPNTGTYVAYLSPDADAVAAMGAIDQLFENGPQRVQATSEDEFQKQFVTMFGNIPFFVSTIGGGVLIAVFFAVMNTMLLAGREQTHDLGLLKALGFTDNDARFLLVAQSLLLCLLGAGLGLLLALVTESMISTVMGPFFPGYHVQPGTYMLGAAIAVGLGLVAGMTPAWRAGRLRPAESLASEE